MLWSFVLEGVGLLGVFIAGRKHWQGWAILLFNVGLWTTYGIQSRQYGFVVASLAYAVVYTRNLLKWRRDKNEDIERCN